MFELFTDQTRTLFDLARQASTRFDHEHTGTEHVLWAMARQPDGLIREILVNLGIEPSRLLHRLEDLMGVPSATPTDESSCQARPLTSGIRAMLEVALAEATSSEVDYIGPGHLLLALIQEHDGLAGQALRDIGADLEKARREVAAAYADPEAEARDAVREGLHGDQRSTVPESNSRGATSLKELVRVRCTMGAMVAWCRLYQYSQIAEAID